ncbi:MAG: class I SAM-dependent methyltransferase [Saprospiraceae bacterium]|nr:class I SAM-dependent methyltransferase [Saprospiraceae bacterium]MDW8483840.1 class I SAM-dependent methyltransferase [Saprospiraceae bacterium]
MNPPQEHTPSQPQIIQQYYRWHARIYDATRWCFLFGRRRLLSLLPQRPALRVVEIGCGTGVNLRRLARQHPDWQLTGIDVSRHMLDRAFKALKPYTMRVFLLEKSYGKGHFHLKEKADVILFSYSLTMINPGFEAAIEQAHDDLKPGGCIAVVDFHDTLFSWFRQWMRLNHVRMEGHLLPVLKQHFETERCEIRRAFGGLWRYMIFVGSKPRSSADA